MEGLVGKRVLVVEDEILVAMLIEETLADAGCVVVGPFSRVAEAISAVVGERIDIALLDVNVADQKVFSVAEALEMRGIPFVFLTGYGSLALPKERPLWVALSKPFDVGTLLGKLEKQIGAHPAPRQPHAD